MEPWPFYSNNSSSLLELVGPKALLDLTEKHILKKHTATYYSSSFTRREGKNFAYNASLHNFNLLRSIDMNSVSPNCRLAEVSIPSTNARLFGSFMIYCFLGILATGGTIHATRSNDGSLPRIPSEE